jgi:hydrogenase-4 component J
MNPRIVIYQLHSKFVNQREDVPEEARQVVYYSLAVGHHVGVMDCFSSIAEIPLPEYSAWLERLPESPGRSKLEGVVKWGEIEINHSHVGLLLPLLDDSNSVHREWLALLVQVLNGMLQEPALYLMLRKRT